MALVRSLVRPARAIGASLCLVSVVLVSASCGGSEDADEWSIAFSSEDTDQNALIYVTDAGAGDARTLTRGWHPDSSPEAVGLVFVDGIDDFDPDVYAIAADGNGRRLIVRNGNHPAPSPDGSRVAFLRWIRSEGADVLVVDAETGRVHRLTTSGRYEWAPVWSPDGRRLAVESTDLETATTSIVLLTSAGGQPQHLTRPPRRSRDHSPAWSPDGALIAFSRTVVRGTEGRVVAEGVYVVDADGSRPRRLTPAGAAAWGASWSPDGTRVAYGCRSGLSRHDICVVNADGTERRSLTTSGADGSPVWSPDGGMIAFVSARDDPPDFVFEQVYVMSSDGSDQRRVSRTGTSDDAPVWLSRS